MELMRFILVEALGGWKYNFWLALRRMRIAWCGLIRSTRMRTYFGNFKRTRKLVGRRVFRVVSRTGAVFSFGRLATMRHNSRDDYVIEFNNVWWMVSLSLDAATNCSSCDFVTTRSFFFFFQLLVVYVLSNEHWTCARM